MFFLLQSFEAVVCLARPADLERITPRMGWFSQTDWAALWWPSHLWWHEMSTIIKMPSLVGGGGKSRKRLRNAWEQSLELNYFNKQRVNWPNVQCWTEAGCRHVILVNSITHKQGVLHAAPLNFSTVPSFQLSTELIILIVCLNTLCMLLQLFMPITKSSVIEQLHCNERLTRAV